MITDIVLHVHPYASAFWMGDSFHTRLACRNHGVENRVVSTNLWDGLDGPVELSTHIWI